MKTVDQWDVIYLRERDLRGHREAAVTLMKGLIRELQSSRERTRPDTPPKKIVDLLFEVENVWKGVADRHPEHLKADGFKKILSVQSPFLYQLMQAKDIYG